jgi:FtsH-binding integral membrane protein
MKYSQQQITEETKRFFQKVYAWMFLGLTISSITAYIIANKPFLYQYILFNNVIFYTLLIVELILIIGLVWLIKKIPAKTAIFLFLLYCFMTGLTLSIIFLMFTIKSITLVFFIAAIMFGVMSIYGYFTKTDLTKLGKVLTMGLIGLIIASLFNFSIKSTLTDYIISFIGVILFTGLTAYDTQKIRKTNIIGNENTPEDTKESVLGAINLYLDFMNLFLKLLRIFGKRR